MKVTRAPDGWPTPGEIGDSVLEAGLIEGAVGIGSATVLGVRPWSVVYSIDIERSTSRPIGLVVKSLREPHHDGPAQGANDARQLRLEHETMERARAQQIPMPRPYGLIPEFAAIVMERVTGERMMSLRLTERRLVPELRETGRGCRRWNSIETDIPGATTTTIDDVVAEVRRHVTVLSDQGVGLATMHSFQDALDAVIPTDDIALVATHGDLHSGNVLVGGASTPIFIDSALVRAPAISDIARLSASIRTSRWSMIGGTIVRSRVERLISALLDGYGDHDRHLYALLELAATLEHWCELRSGLSTGDLRWPRRRAVRLVDTLFTAELERWHERVRSFSAERST